MGSRGRNCGQQCRTPPDSVPNSEPDKIMLGRVLEHGVEESGCSEKGKGAAGFPVSPNFFPPFCCGLDEFFILSTLASIRAKSASKESFVRRMDPGRVFINVLRSGAFQPFEQSKMGCGSEILFELSKLLLFPWILDEKNVFSLEEWNL